MGAYDIQDLARSLSAIGSEERLRIIGLIMRRPELGCAELAHELGLSQPAISYHLKVLEAADLIVKIRRGRTRCLSVTPKIERILRAEVIRWLKQEEVKD